jgi:hypothetical protein
LVSQKWQVDNYTLLIDKFNNQNIDILFLCVDLISKGDSFQYLNKIKKFNYELIPYNKKNFVLSSLNTTIFLISLLKNKYNFNLSKIIFISENYSNIFVSSLRNIKLLFNSQLIFLQHGENHFNNQEFDYYNGWHYNKIQKKKFTKKTLFDIVLIIILSIKFFKKINLTNPIINYKYDYLSFANKIFVTNQNNKNCLVNYGINKRKIYVVGSVLNEKKSSFVFKNTHNIKYELIIIYSSGTYRKSLDIKDTFKQKLFFSNLIEVAKLFNLKCYFKLKPDEEFYFNKYHPNNFYFSDDTNFDQFVNRNNCKNFLHILPVDSTLCLEFSLAKIPYLTFSTWNSYSTIGTLNVDSGIKNLKFNIKQKHLSNEINKILNFDEKLIYINSYKLENLLGNLNESYNEKIFQLIK